LSERERSIFASRDAARFKDKARRVLGVEPLDDETGTATGESADCQGRDKDASWEFDPDFAEFGCQQVPEVDFEKRPLGLTRT
jgi:hypothetical protein